MEPQPGPSFRRFFGGLFCFAVAALVIHGGTPRVPYWQILLMLLGSLLPIFFVLLVLAARWALKDKGHWQFQLNSLFLAMICPAIYLAALRWYLHAIRTPPESLTWKGWLVVLAANVVLLAFLMLPVMAVGETLLWFGVWCVRRLNRRLRH